VIKDWQNQRDIARNELLGFLISQETKPAMLGEMA
jgi:hypothetical protein